ncbi:hypothetical protein CC86DRAFT_381958 [Ophiobolus disseminans]|uniref:Uncharacterized protein n=1 Tax=Ophiobolus disseminans TaxID=1469910 RepID=A0A6A7A2B2_9PLEO|nr:hypothetical protein CC86DRAFT_381958 [Ophiobolus disseminans]
MSHTLSFFGRLPYDIRAIVYQYLEPDQSPPFSPNDANMGFLLSCRQAKQELSELAVQTVEDLVADFNNTAPRGAEINMRSGALRCIAVNVPFSALFGSSKKGKMKRSWRQEVFASLHPLFAQYFEVVRIHITHGLSEFDTQQSLELDTLYDRGHFEVDMHNLLRDISYMIQHVNSDRQRNTDLFPTTYVKARRICLSWNLRTDVTSGDSPIIMNGKLHQAKPTRCNPTAFDDHDYNTMSAVTLDTLSQHDDNNIDLSSSKQPIFYHLHDSQRLVGEMCLQHNSRWRVSETRYYNGVLNGQETLAEYISSYELGRRPRKGLNGVTPEEYEKAEIEVQQVLWAT